jgi:hypothetical protein
MPLSLSEPPRRCCPEKIELESPAVVEFCCVRGFRSRGERRREATGVRGNRKQRNGKRILGALWLPVVIVSVIVVAGYGVTKVRQSSQAVSHPPTTSSIPHTVVQINPKNVTYEVFGDLGGGGKVAYANLDSEPVNVPLTSLPWSHSETTMSSAATLSLVSQVEGGSVGCRIIVDGEVRDEHMVSHESAAVACTVTAA